MKKLLTLLLAALYLASCGKTHTIEYPTMESYDSFRVHKIELTDSTTIIHAGAYAFEEYWFRLQGDKGEYYLAGRTTGNRYQLLGIEGIELNKKYTIDASGVLLFTLRFEPVAKEDKAVDMVLDGSESLNIRGLSLQQPEITRPRRIKGEVVSDKTKAVILIRDDLFQTAQSIESFGTVIPLIDGKFQIDIPTEGDDFYTLIAWEQHIRGSMSTCEFFVAEKEVDIVCDFEEMSNSVVSGEINHAIKALKQRAQAVAAPYDKQLEELEEQGFYFSDVANDILARAEAESDRDKALALYIVMKTFLGKIEAKIDAKGRVFVPSVFRKVFSEEDRERVVVRMEADEKYLVVYPESVWNKQVLDLQSKLNEWDSEDQMLLMQFVGDAEILDFDSQGRVLLPKRLQVRLGGGSELIFVGMVDRIALWSKSKYEERFAMKDKLSERLKMLGRKE